MPTLKPLVNPLKAPLTGSNPEHSRLHNRRVVLGQIRYAGRMGRAEIARATGLSIQAVSNIISTLETEGLLKIDGQLSHGRGLPAPQYALNGAGAHALGIEIRPQSITGVVLDMTGSTCATIRESVSDNRAQAVCLQAKALMEKLLLDARLERSNMMGAGVVMPGPLIPTGLAKTTSVLPDWEGVDPEKLFQTSLQLPVVIENDANAAAVGERVCGCTNQINNYAFVYFGTGLGLGIVQEGRLFRGATGNAGELGHIQVPSPALHDQKNALTRHATEHPLADNPHEPEPSDNSHTTMVSLETIASRQALRERLHAIGMDVGSVSTLNTLMEDCHPVIERWLDDAALALSYAIHTIENLFDPETILISGALPDSMLAELVQRIALSSLSTAHRDQRTYPRVMQGSSGRMSAAQGGAALVINQLFTPRLSNAA